MKEILMEINSRQSYIFKIYNLILVSKHPTFLINQIFDESLKYLKYKLIDTCKLILDLDL